MPSAEHARPRILDLDDLESDTAPLFVIKTVETALEFEPLFYNESFRQLHLHGSILAQDKAALLFRSWAQALGDFYPEHEFGGRIWRAESAGRNGGWKVVKAKASKERTQLQPVPDEDATDGRDRTTILTRSKTEFMRGFKRGRKFSLEDIPRTHLHARWESIQTMMEMSDVGVFEYNSEGRLLHANEAWYRLRYVHAQCDQSIETM